MDTKLSIEEILVALHGSCIWNKRSDMFVPNLSWGLLNHEADLVIVNKTGYLTEVEIKRSWEDFKADFKKKHTHNNERVYRFYYCVPVSILDKVKEFLLKVVKEDKSRKNPSALISYTEDGRVKIEDFGISYKEGARKLFLEECLTVARLGVLRYWNLMEKVYPLKKIGKGNNSDIFIF